MFPHYMEVAGWLALAAVLLAWVLMAAYLTFDLTTRSNATTPTPWRWIVVIWALPIVGVAMLLASTRRSRRRA